MINYTNHPETSDTKAHTDILLDNLYIGYFIKTDVLSAFFEWRTELFCGEFKTVKQLEKAINKVIN